MVEDLDLNNNAIVNDHDNGDTTMMMIMYIVIT